MNKFKRFIEALSIYLVSGCLYVLIEILYRGKSHYSMFILAGICGLVMAFLNDKFNYDMDFLLQIFICTVFCTFMEFVFGMIFNSNYLIWDYRHLWGTFAYGQCNIYFVFIWAILSSIGIPLLDWVEYCFFDEEKPYYKIFNRRIKWN